MRKKSGLLALLLLLFAWFCSAQNKTKTNLSIMNLRGNVKAIYDSLYSAKDESGKIIKLKTDINLNGKFEPLGTYFAVFDEKGNKTEEKQLQNHSHITDKYRIKYNEKGKITELKYFKTDTVPIYTISYKYDENGTLIEEDCQYSAGNKSQISDKYDSAGFHVEKIYHSSETSAIDKITNYINNEKGLKIQEDETLSDGTKVSQTKYKYDNKDNIIETLVFIPDTNQAKPFGLESWLLNEKHSFKYDKNNNVIEEIISQPEKKISSKFSYRYEYDRQGNWIKQIKFIDDKVKYITERKIEYF